MRTLIVDSPGSNTPATVRAGSSLPAATDQALVVTLRDAITAAITGALTNTELRATPVPVSGTVSLAATPTIDIGDVTLLAGTALIGQVGLDQTTPGTTNGVVPASATVAASTAYVASLVVKASAGSLYGFTGYNSGPDQFIQVHNSATLPAEAAVPLIAMKIFADSNFGWTSGNASYPFTTGITICNSTTAQTKTIGSANIWANALYR